MNKKVEVLTLAFCIALFPPLWAVLAPFIHVSTGAVALICAGIYGTNNNQRKAAIPISIGFLLGDLWAVAALFLMEKLPFAASLNTFLVLFLFGGLAVILSACLPKYIHCPSWLCGWAIGLTIMGPLGFHGIHGKPIEIAVAMLVGVWYVGVLLNGIQKKLCQWIGAKNESSRR